MHIGVLTTGWMAENLAPEHGEYPQIFARLYHRADPAIRISGFAVVDGEFPSSPAACDAWLVTGSKHGVYDDLPFIEPLKAFLRDARAARVPMIGICFGHQIMAEAFGGRAVKFDGGWACGVHRYTVERRPAWMADADAQFGMHAMHQDQVVDLPADATRLATSAFCENAMLTYGDPEAPDAISIQPHPEFSRALAEGLVRLRKTETIPDAVADPALKSFGTPVAGDDFAEWSLAYLRQALGRN